MKVNSVSSLAIALFVLLTGSAFAAERHELHGHVPNVARHLQSVGRLSADKNLKLVIGLPLRNREGLTNLLQDIYDPSSPNFRHYLTPTQFTAQFGPTEDDYDAVMAFARSNHLRITGTHSNRTILEVSGKVADVERAFQVNLHVYQHPTEQRTFFAPDAEPSVEAGTPILHVSGLNNYVLPHPKFHRTDLTKGLAKVGTGPGGRGFMGKDLRTAYAPGVTNTGAGQSVALVEFDGYYTSDVLKYQTYAQIPKTIQLNNVLLPGFDGTPGTSGGNEEVALDIEMAMSMAPGLSSIYVYEENYPTNDPFTANILLNRIASDDSANQISCSWVVPIDDTSEQIFQQYMMQGQTFFDASGDDGALIGDVSPPSDNPYMTQVGGTILTTSGAGGPWLSETVWNQGSATASSGGVSDVFAIPAWQQGINMTGNKGSATMRNFPDVAAVAENLFIVADNGQLETIGGTSCAAPLWAGLNALVNQQAANSAMPPVGFINPMLYAIAQESMYSSNFHDVTIGNSYNSFTPSQFQAVPGYDLCTGIGTPKGNNLIHALLAPADSLQIAPLPGFTAAGAVHGPFNITSQTYVLTNAGLASFNWTNFRTATWLSVSTNNGTLAPGDSAAVTVSLNAAASNLVAGVYKASVWFTNQSTHLAQCRQFALQVGQPILANGSFETGDFSYWILANDNGTYNFVDNSSIIPQIRAHLGTHFAALGQSNTPLATLTQTVPTIPGRYYTISYWLTNPNLGNGTFPNEFSVTWNSNVISDRINLPTSGAWTKSQFIVMATDTTTELQFGFRNDWSDFGFDDVEVTLLPETAPAVTFKSPAPNASVTNSAITITGTAIDNVATSNVLYSLNGSDWTQCVTSNNWTNWSADVQLAPGTNTFAIEAIDVSGDISTNHVLKVFYVVPAQLLVSTTGNGTFTPNNYNGAMLDIGRNYTLTATASPGFGFTNWTGSVSNNKAALTFMMESNFTLTANFVDIQKPTLTIATPTNKMTVTNANFTMLGTAKDNVAVANVYYLLNGVGPTLAATTNNWTNWTAPITLDPGTNIITVYAVDTTGNNSTNHTVALFYAVPTPLTLIVNGKGTVTPNDNNVNLDIGRNYTLSATAAAGFAFTNWTGGINTNKAVLTFMMSSGLTLYANFVDVQRPAVTITSFVSGQKSTNVAFPFSGKSSDNVGVQNVYFQVNGLGWTNASTANNFTNWSGSISLNPGTNTIQAYAVDTTGNQSAITTAKVDCTAPSDWAPDSVAGMTASATPIPGKAFSMSFDPDTFSITGTDTNFENYGVGDYSYVKTGTNTAQLFATNGAPPTVTTNLISMELLFTNANKATYSNDVSGEVGTIKFANAVGVAPADVVKVTLNSTNGAGNMVVTLNDDSTFTTSANPPASGNYTLLQYSPTAAMLTLNFTDPVNSGITSYMQMTFLSVTNGGFFGTALDTQSDPPTFNYGKLVVP